MTLPISGPVAKKAAELAKAFADAGTEEVGNNRGKQVEAFLRSAKTAPGNPWCAAFVTHCIQKADTFVAGTPAPPDFPASAYCPDYKNWAKKHGVWINVADAVDGDPAIQKGDLCLFYFSAKQRVAHIGFVMERSATGFKSIEGNTGPEHGSVVNRDGDGCYVKHRSFAELGAFGGFVRLAF